jgi:hypothetical protein
MKRLPPPTRPLIVRPSVYRRKFKYQGKPHVAEFHPDKIVLHRCRSPKRAEFSFIQLMQFQTGSLL